MRQVALQIKATGAKLGTIVAVYKPVKSGFFYCPHPLSEIFAMEMIRKPAPAVSILIVEDDDLSRTILATIIPKRFPHATVYSAANGKAGLELMKTHSPDIVITDIVMPEMDGARMASRISSVNPDTKLIVITADSERQVRKGATLSGVTIDHYVFKPVCCPDLFAAIEQCITEMRGGAA